MQNVFDATAVATIINRIEQLNKDTERLWGSMTVAQMLAHCNVAYEMVYEDKHPKPNFIMRFILKLFVKNTVVNTTPYAKESRTAPQFLIKESKDFAIEKTRLIDYINKTLSLGSAHFDNKASHSFGSLSTTEWNNMFYKHLDHHLRQFGV